MAQTNRDPFGIRVTLDTSNGTASFFSLPKLGEAGVDIERMPFSLRVLLENMARNCDGRLVTENDVKGLMSWDPKAPTGRDIPFMPARVVLQDFTGVPAVVDLAAMRSAMKRMGGDPNKINPLVPVDLVIDHSVQVDMFGTTYAFARNVEMEYKRNGERYALLRWAQEAFDNFRVVPPGTGIVHQVNLEYLGKVVQLREQGGELRAYPDTLVGTDSHTTMINGLGVLGWGVGGIEAEAVMLGQPYAMLTPEVVGFRLTGALPEGATATDLVLTVTQMLRKKGVVGKFVEFYGPGLSNLPVADRATIGNMSPEYGATMGFFPVDQETLNYLRLTGRDEEHVQFVERYCKEQGLFRTDGTRDPEYNDTLTLDMSTVEPSMAGPRRPQDRVLLSEVKDNFFDNMKDYLEKSKGTGRVPGVSGSGVGAGSPASGGGAAVAVAAPPKVEVSDGAVAIAAITSCTNTSNPSVMVAAGLLAKKAVERGLDVKPWVKTSLAPGSRVVTDYLKEAGLLTYLEALRYHVVGYGCTTCIGNSGTLPEQVMKQVEEDDLVVAAVLSGNRNFEGRINPLVKANYLASPPLVVAYALAGRIDIDLQSDPVGYDPNGDPVYLKDIWPTQQEVSETIERALKPDMFRERYAEVFDGDERWRSLPVPTGELYEWDPESTYIQEPPFFVDMPRDVEQTPDIEGGRLLVKVGDSITTDHISPAGAIAKESPAAEYLRAHGVENKDFNTYGARRGNHEVMMRGTFGNIRLRNELAPGTEGGYTTYYPDGGQTTIFDASERYQEAGVPLLIVAGKEYGTGSSRDWAAKGTLLLGAKAVIAESYERIHRSNLIGMGVLPLQFKEGENAETLGLNGDEVYTISGIQQMKPGQELTVTTEKGGEKRSFQAIARIDSEVELDYYRNGGILQAVLRRMLA